MRHYRLVLAALWLSLAVAVWFWNGLPDETRRWGSGAALVLALFNVVGWWVGRRGKKA
jgi:hypothetical protein